MRAKVFIALGTDSYVGNSSCRFLIHSRLVRRQQID